MNNIAGLVKALDDRIAFWKNTKHDRHNIAATLLTALREVRESVMESIPPESFEKDECLEWWERNHHLPKFQDAIITRNNKALVKLAWTEATRQALEQPCPHCKGKRTSGD